MRRTVVKEQIDQLNHFFALDLLKLAYQSQHNGELPEPKEKVMLLAGGRIPVAYGLSQNTSTDQIKEKLLEVIDESNYD